MLIPTISLWEPWATLWVHGFKVFETRSWRPPFAEPTVLAVQVAARWEKDQQKLVHQSPFKECLAPGWNYHMDYLHAGIGFHFGHIIGLVRVVDWYATEGIRHQLGEQELAFGDYTNGRFAWRADMWHVFRNPIKFPGKQKIFKWAAPEGTVAPIVLDMDVQGALDRQDKYPPPHWGQIGGPQ